jgi:hypothetical protein
MGLQGVGKRIGGAALLSVTVAAACGGSDPAGPMDGGEDPGSIPDVSVCTPAGNTAGWSFARLGVGAKPAITIGQGGTVHAAFMNEALDGWVRYAKLSVGASSPSSPETVDAGYFYGPIDIVLDGGGLPYISFHDHDLEDQVLGQRSVSGGWSLHAMTNLGHDGWYNKAVRGSDGTVHTATFDPGGFSGRGVNYGGWNGSSWTIELAAPGSFDYAGGTAIALTADGRIHIAFFDDVEGALRLATRSGPDDWDVTTVEPIGEYLEAGRFPDLEVDPDGQTLHLVYLARTASTEGIVRYARGRPDAFELSDVTAVSGFTIGFSGARDLATLDIDGSGVPIVAVQTKSLMELFRVEAAGVVKLASFQAPSGVTFKQQTDVEIDDAGKVHVAWWQSGDVPGTVCHGVSG